jgi:hypothetical protein
MTTDRVTWLLVPGLRAVGAFLDLLGAVAHARGCHAEPWEDEKSIGLRLNNGDDWLGLYFEQPEYLQFITNQRKVDPAAAAQLGLDEGIFDWEDGESHGWQGSLDLDCAETHFFARSRDSQAQLLTAFLQECLEAVRRIEWRGGSESPAGGEEPALPETQP